MTEHTQLKQQVVELQARVAELEAELGHGKRREITNMSDEVREDNPYSRLMALKKMGVVDDYEKIRTKCIAIVGVGGVGSVVAEMLVRCGVGRILLFDYDQVHLANMNRLFFRPEHDGMHKVEAARRTLRHINPDVSIESYPVDVSAVDGHQVFHRNMESVDMILCCVDNYGARISVNRTALEKGTVWMESGVSEDALNGHIHTVIPGSTPCYECMPPFAVHEGTEHKIRRDGVCAASLPTTMGIIAGMLAHNALKHLLQFGHVSKYITYSSANDHFQHIPMLPNNDCPNYDCRSYQQSIRLNEDRRHKQDSLSNQRPDADEDITHPENEWDIQVVNEEPEENEENNEHVNVEDVKQDESLEDLKQQLQSI
eukprot:gb/GECH01013710.1/.p1 GENE.gb/GECH01013710.1/~~gb/GECH01013710.1/.p1  ORF type:complete len:371 (+),score=76.38 gb/GECH01013710.1/:1-1113(+)